MVKHLTLKEDSLEHLEKITHDIQIKNVRIVGMDGKGWTCNLVLASLSPWIKDLLASLPPHIDASLILPDIPWSDIQRFLESLGQPNQFWDVSQVLLKLLKIDLIDSGVDMLDKPNEISEDLRDADCYNYSLEFVEDVINDDKFQDVNSIDNEQAKDNKGYTKNRHKNENKETKNKHEKKLSKSKAPCILILCMYCKKGFKSELKLKRHIKRNPIDHPSIGIGEKQYKEEKDIKTAHHVEDFNTEDTEEQLQKASVINSTQEVIKQEPSTVKLIRSIHKKDSSSKVGHLYYSINGIFKCLLCNKDTIKRKHMKHHIEGKHKLKTSQCEYCSELVSIHALKRHKLIHTQAKDTFCDMCGKGFRTIHNLKIHKIVHLSLEEKNKLKKHNCNTCDSSFINKTKLRNHMECHNEEKTFFCELCGNAYRTSKAIGWHYRNKHKQSTS